MRSCRIVLAVVGLLTASAAAAWAYPPADSLIRWRPYTEETFAQARTQEKPFFLIFTAEWCYWCHEYEARSLETKEVSEILNASYVPIVLDYDLRSDLRRKYRARGLPTTVILSPAGEILVAVPGFIHKERLVVSLRRTLALIEKEVPKAPEAEGREVVLARTVPQWVRDASREVRDAYDPDYGGFWGSAKLPRPSLLEYALARGGPFWTKAATKTLEAIAGLHAPEASRGQPTLEELRRTIEESRGPEGIEVLAALQREDPLVGLYDPVEGGFFRYATQRDWSRPHFEKLLELNAELARIYLLAFQKGGRDEFRKVGLSSLEYLLKTLWDDARGAFFNSQIADEVYYHGTGPVRAGLARPPVHRIITTVANAAAVRALVAGEKALASPRFREPARRALEFMLTEMRTEAGINQSFDVEEEKPAIDGQLADHAHLARALLEAAEAWDEPRYRRATEVLLAEAEERLWDGEEGAYRERHSRSRRAYRAGEERSDVKPPMANGVMAQALLAAARATGKESYRKRAEAVLGHFASRAPDPQEASALLLAAHQMGYEGLSKESAAGPSND